MRATAANVLCRHVDTLPAVASVQPCLREVPALGGGQYGGADNRQPTRARGGLGRVLAVKAQLSPDLHSRSRTMRHTSTVMKRRRRRRRGWHSIMRWSDSKWGPHLSPCTWALCPAASPRQSAAPAAQLTGLISSPGSAIQHIVQGSGGGDGTQLAPTPRPAVQSHMRKQP